MLAPSFCKEDTLLPYKESEGSKDWSGKRDC